MLTGTQILEFREALLSAYPSKQKLEQMVRIQLNVHLTQIAGGENLSDVVFSLIIWAESEGKIRELMTKSHEYNPGNARLKDFASQFSTPEPTSSTAASPNSSATKSTPSIEKMTLREMRQHLKKYFDDVQLNELCQDYFPEVYNRFSVGMRTDSKINELLDYCRRVDERTELLQTALEEFGTISRPDSAKKERR